MIIHLSYYSNKLTNQMQQFSSLLLDVLFCQTCFGRLHAQHLVWPQLTMLLPQAARLLRSWVRIPPGAWIFVCCECRVLSGRGLCDDLITRPEESYRLCCVVVCDLETSRIGAPYIYIYIYIYMYI